MIINLTIPLIKKLEELTNLAANSINFKKNFGKNKRFVDKMASFG